MRLGSAVLAFVTSAACASAQTPFSAFEQHPMLVPEFESAGVVETLASAKCPPEGPVVKRIAIIGAGASGSSAALWLSTAQSKLDDLWTNGARDCPATLDVTVFERSEQVGGRSRVVHPYNNTSYPPVELGASIFADVNPNMVRFTERYGLNATARLGEEDSTTSLWDGQSFIFEDLGEGWWNSAKMLWRYGYSPGKVAKYVASTVATYLNQYNPIWVHNPSAALGGQYPWPWSSPEALLDVLGYAPLVATAALDRLYDVVGASKLFIEEIVEAATRVNYGQNIEAIHALGAGVSLAASGARGVQGGNYRVFEHMLGEAGARLRLGPHGAVSGIIKFASLNEALQSVADGTHTLSTSALVQAAEAAESGSWTKGQHKWYVGTTSNYGSFYDAVIVAAPWHSTNIRVVGASQVVPRTEYVRLHVTLLVTNASQPSGVYFGKGSGSVVSRTILTALGTTRGRSTKDTMPEFNSLNYLVSLGSTPSSESASAREEEHVVKIFSPARMTDETLRQLFGGTDNVLWVHRHVWEAYPYLRPTTRLPPLQVDQGLLYPNSFEPVLSTMETSTLSAKNAVALLLQDWFGPEFVHGTEEEGCKSGGEAPSTSDTLETDWAGWGCHSA